MPYNINDITLKFCEDVLIPVIQTAVNENIKKRDYGIEYKGQGNIVTSADKNIETALKAALKDLIPDSSFIAEESGIDDYPCDLIWIIDPIDGTSNFVYGYPYSTSVALVDKNKQEVVAGIVYDAKDEITYYACKGEGSFKRADGKKVRLKVSEFDEGEGIAIFGMPYDRSKANKILRIAEKFYPLSSDLKRIGPSSLDICRVASGQAKFYFELDLEPWDIAAGYLILTEAGGKYRKEEDLSIFEA